MNGNLFLFFQPFYKRTDQYITRASFKNIYQKFCLLKCFLLWTASSAERRFSRSHFVTLWEFVPECFLLFPGTLQRLYWDKLHFNAAVSFLSTTLTMAFLSCKMLDPFRPKLNLAKMLPQYDHFYLFFLIFMCKSSLLVKYMMRWTVLLDNLPRNCQGRGWKDCCCGNFQEFLVLNQCFASGRPSFHVSSLYCNLPTLAGTKFCFLSWCSS